MKKMVNYYEKLGVSPEMSCEEIKNAINEEEYGVMTESQRNMFTVLTDEEYREDYDAMLKDWNQRVDDLVAEFELTGSDLRFDVDSYEEYFGYTNDEREAMENYYNEFFASEEVSSIIDRNEAEYLAKTEEYYNEFFASLSDEAPMVLTPEVEEVSDAEVENITEEELDALGTDVTVENKSFFKKHLGKIVLVTLAGVAIIAGAHSCNKKNGNNVTPTVTPVPTKKPSVTATVTPTPTVVPTATPTPIPEVGMTANEINEVANVITAENALKGLYVDYNQLTTALAFANLTSLSNQAINTMFGDEDMTEMFKQSHKYIDKVANNNIFNALDEEKYVRISDLVGNQTDKEILCSLEDCYLEFVKAANEGTLTNEEYQALVTNICGFYYRETNFFNTEAKSDYDALSAGAKYLADKCIFPQFNMSFYESEFMTDANEQELRRLQTSGLDGGNYKTDILCYIDSAIASLEQEKQLVK